MADPTEVAVEAGDLLRALNRVREVIPIHGDFRPKQLEPNMHESTLSPIKKCELMRDLSTPENRAFWAVADRARERVSAWPEWKRNLKVLREQEGHRDARPDCEG